MIRICLIDDESPVRETIRTILTYYYNSLEIEEASGVEEGLKLLSTFKADLVFLDIEMDDGTGFDLLTRLPSVPWPVVFITAHNEYAVKAFKFSALDYILKPIDPEEIRKSVEKVRKQKDNTDRRFNSFLHNWKEGQLERIVLCDLTSIHVVELREIIRCQSVSNYTHFYLTEKREIIISTTLKHYDELLSGQGFFRVHQSHIINMNHLSKFSKKEGGEVVMKDGSTVPVSSRKKEGLLNILKSLKS